MLFVHKKNKKKVIFLDGFFSATKRMVANLEIDCHNKTKRFLYFRNVKKDLSPYKHNKSIYD